METILLPLLVLLASCLYSSVGHGGASAYLAVMALLGYPKYLASTSALTLNILVSGLAFSAFARAGYYRGRLIVPFLIASMPAAFLGGYLEVSARAYSLILGTALALAAARMWWEIPIRSETPIAQPQITSALLIGAGLGLVSGMIGIGGGVFLSPILLLARWANVKETAAASSLFILLNSLAGLSGHLSRTPGIFTGYWLVLSACAFAGGWYGSRLGAGTLSSLTLRRLLGAVLLAAALKLLSS